MTNTGTGAMIVTDDQVRAMIATGRVRVDTDGRGRVALRVTHESTRYGGGYVGYRLSGGRWHVDASQFRIDSPWRIAYDAALVAANVGHNNHDCVEPWPRGSLKAR